MSDIRNIDVEVIEMIKVVRNVGEGVVGDPIRLVTEYWDMYGGMISRKDPCRKEVSQDD